MGEDETVETAVIFKGDAVIDGTVAEWLVVLDLNDAGSVEEARFSRAR